MSKDHPTEQDIRVYLDGLNRVTASHSLSTESARAKQKGINGYVRWFKEHGILVRQERGVWRVVEVLDDIGVKER